MAPWCRYPGKARRRGLAAPSKSEAKAQEPFVLDRPGVGHASAVGTPRGTYHRRNDDSVRAANGRHRQVRLTRRDTSALAVGSVVTGVLAYVFFAVTTRALGPETAAPVSVLWTYWSFSAAAMTFPLQHWIARTAAAHRDESDVRSALPRLISVVLFTALLIGLVSWVAREQLFHRDGLAFPSLMAAVTLGAGVLGVSRGTLTARRRFRTLAAALVAENALRCLTAVLLVLADVHHPVAYGAALLVGYVVVLASPASLRLRRSADRLGSAPSLRSLRGASGGQLLAQIVLTGAPVLLALAGGMPVDVTAMFAGLALFRAPYVVVLGLVSQLTGLLTTWVVQDRRSSLDHARRLVAGLTVAAAAFAAVLGSTVGPALVRLIFGSEVRLEPLHTMLLAIGNAVALGSLVLTILVLARDRSAGVARAWLIACLVAGVFFTMAGGDSLDRACWTFALAQGAALLVLLVEEYRAALRTRGAMSSGSHSVAPPR